jgi:hypothetical protein
LSGVIALHDLFVPLATSLQHGFFFNLILLVTLGIAAFYFLLFLLDLINACCEN